MQQLWKAAMLLFCGVLLSGEVLAIGISPAVLTVKFQPDSQKKFTFTTNNNEDGERMVNVSVNGELAAFTSCTQEAFVLKVGEAREFQCTLTMPHIMEPGEHGGRVRVTGYPYESASAQGAFIGGIAAVETILNVNVPYVGPWLSVGLETQNALPGDTIGAKVKYDAIGTETVHDIATTISIFDKNNASVASQQAGSFDLDAGQTAEKSFTFDTKDMQQGSYTVRAVAHYADKSSTVERPLLFGELVLEVIGMRPVTVPENTIAKFTFIIKNAWDRDVSTKTRIEALDAKGKVLAKTEADGIAIGERQQRDVEMYLDTAGIPKGVYDVRITLGYGGKSRETRVKSGLIITPLAQAASWGWVPIALVAAVCIILVLLLKRRKREGQ